MNAPKHTTNQTEAKVKAILGSSYGWDSELGELQYQGNPISFWITESEKTAVKQATENQST
jgi:hypothetical protein